MITKIEIKNFQSHKNTTLEFDKGVNVITGESDNGKSAVIRAIRWVVENYPSGTEKINSSWNEDFKEPLSVKLYTENGYVERIRTKTRNGYTINGKELSAVGRGVPQEVIDFLNVSDVNFQFQMDPPYLLSMTGGAASQYLNNIVHLDSIDKILSLSDSDKRQLSSEQKLVEADIKKLETELESLQWVDEANNISKRVDKLDEIINNVTVKSNNLESSMNEFREIENNKIDLTEHLDLISQIESITIPDTDILENEINTFKDCQNVFVDLAEVEKLQNEIDSIIITDTAEFETSVRDYKNLTDNINKAQNELEELKKQLPKICPTCGAELKEELCL